MNTYSAPNPSFLFAPGLPPKKTASKNPHKSSRLRLSGRRPGGIRRLPHIPSLLDAILGCLMFLPCFCWLNATSNSCWLTSNLFPFLWEKCWFLLASHSWSNSLMKRVLWARVLLIKSHFSWSTQHFVGYSHSLLWLYFQRFVFCLNPNLFAKWYIYIYIYLVETPFCLLNIPRPNFQMVLNDEPRISQLFRFNVSFQ